MLSRPLFSQSISDSSGERSISLFDTIYQRRDQISTITSLSLGIHSLVGIIVAYVLDRITQFELLRIIFTLCATIMFFQDAIFTFASARITSIKETPKEPERLSMDEFISYLQKIFQENIQKNIYIRAFLTYFWGIGVGCISLESLTFFKIVICGYIGSQLYFGGFIEYASRTRWIITDLKAKDLKNSISILLVLVGMLGVESIVEYIYTLTSTLIK